MKIQPKQHLEKIFRSPPEEYDRTSYIRLDKNESTIPFPEELIQLFTAEMKPDFFSVYPQVYQLYEELTKYLSIDKENCIITAGSDAAIKNIFEVYVRYGDEVLLPDPTYAMYEIYSELFEAKIIKIPYNDDLSFPIEDFLTAITPKTRLVVFPNPNSPTGTIISREDIIRILNSARHYQTLVLIDEAYFPYYPHTSLDLLKKYDNLIVTRTFSKAFGLASSRIGYAVSTTEIISNLKKFRPIYEINGFAVVIGRIALTHPDYMMKCVREIGEGKEYLIGKMTELGLKIYPSYSNFVHIIVGEENAGPLGLHLEKEGILIKSGFEHPALRKCIRVTLSSQEDMKICSAAIKDFFENKI